MKWGWGIDFICEGKWAVYDEYVAVKMEWPFIEDPFSEKDSYSKSAIKWINNA